MPAPHLTTPVHLLAETPISGDALARHRHTLRLAATVARTVIPLPPPSRT